MPENHNLDFSMRRYYHERAPEYNDWYERRGSYNDPSTNSAWHTQLGELAREITLFTHGLPGGPEIRILEVACGTGKWTPFLAKPLHPRARLTAFDFSSAMLAENREKLAGEGQDLLARVDFVRGDAYSLPFESNSFDCVFFGFWLSHVPRDLTASFMEEIKRVLKPGGKVLIFDSVLQPGKATDQVQTRSLKNGSQHQVLKIYYTPPELEALLEQTFSQAYSRQTRDFFILGFATL